jgi:hypothetical protein
MKTAHTDGPWRIWETPTDQNPQAVVSSASGFVAQTLGGNDVANATLIAAAPELLEVLKQIVNDLPTKRDWLDPVVELMAKDAIAKATGC